MFVASGICSNLRCVDVLTWMWYLLLKDLELFNICWTACSTIVCHAIHVHRHRFCHVVFFVRCGATSNCDMVLRNVHALRLLPNTWPSVLVHTRPGIMSEVNKRRRKSKHAPISSKPDNIRGPLIRSDEENTIRNRHICHSIWMHNHSTRQTWNSPEVYINVIYRRRLPS